MSTISINILPRQTLTWNDFVETTPSRSIALDGMVSGGPKWDEDTLHVNFDHHDGVSREATMSTAMQVYFAIKAGLLKRFEGGPVQVYINDPDQDTALACWLLLHHKQFTGTQSHPVMSRLLALNDRLDITGGAFPMSLDDKIVKQHAWVFSPYTDLRKSGELASAGEATFRNTLLATFDHLDKLWLGQALEKELDTRHKILYTSSTHGFRIVDEIGGNEARYALFSQGMLENGYVSLVATRPDGKFVYTIGRPSPYTKFPLQKFYDALNLKENIEVNGWGGSNLVGGSSRSLGSSLSWWEIRDVLEDVMCNLA